MITYPPGTPLRPKSTLGAGYLLDLVGDKLPPSGADTLPPKSRYLTTDTAPGARVSHALRVVDANGNACRELCLLDLRSVEPDVEMLLKINAALVAKVPLRFGASMGKTKPWSFAVQHALDALSDAVPGEAASFWPASTAPAEPTP